MSRHGKDEGIFRHNGVQDSTHQALIRISHQVVGQSHHAFFKGRFISILAVSVFGQDGLHGAFGQGNALVQELGQVLGVFLPGRVVGKVAPRHVAVRVLVVKGIVGTTRPLGVHQGPGAKLMGHSRRGARSGHQVGSQQVLVRIIGRMPAITGFRRLEARDRLGVGVLYQTSDLLDGRVFFFFVFVVNNHFGGTGGNRRWETTRTARLSRRRLPFRQSEQNETPTAQ